MTNLKHFLVVASFAALACTGLRAQSIDMRVTIPFDFHAGERLLPSGDYLIHEDGPVAYVSEVEGARAHTLLMTHGTASRASAPKAGLTFNRYGSEYFLTTIWSPSKVDGLGVFRTSREKELARGDVPTRALVIVASSK